MYPLFKLLHEEKKKTRVWLEQKSSKLREIGDSIIISLLGVCLFSFQGFL
jgi:hypothetical protein